MKIYGVSIKLCSFFETDKESLQATIIDIICEDILNIENYEIDSTITLDEEQLKTLAQSLLEHYNLEGSYDSVFIIDELEKISF